MKITLPKNIGSRDPGWVPFAERLATKSQIASYFQVNVRTIERWMRTGYLPYRKVGGQVRFRMGDVVVQVDQNHRRDAPN